VSATSDPTALAAPTSQFGKARQRFTWRDALLVAASSLVCLFVLELVLRIFYPLYPSPFQADDVLLVKLIPGARKVYTRLAVNGGQRIVSQINSDGFRGEELRPLDGHPRLIVYGDSNVEGEFSPLEATFVKQLEAQLQRSVSGDVEAINAGVVGYGPDQASRRMPTDLARYKPGLVVLVLFADNDFGDLIRNRIYRLDEHGELALNHYRLPTTVREHYDAAAHPRGLHRLQVAKYAYRLWLALRPAPATASNPDDTDYIALSLKQNLSDYAASHADGDGVIESHDPLGDYYDAAIALEPDSEAARYETALMERVLVRMRDLASRAATNFVAVILPAGLDACDHYDFEVDARKYPQYDRRRLSGLVAGMAERHAIDAVDLWPAFRSGDGTCYYLHGGDNHWSEAGQALAARLTADLIIRRSLLHRRS